jgi:hypothetical protein
MMEERLTGYLRFGPFNENWRVNGLPKPNPLYECWIQGCAAKGIYIATIMNLTITGDTQTNFVFSFPRLRVGSSLGSSFQSFCKRTMLALSPSAACLCLGM